MNLYSYESIKPCFNLHLKNTTKSWCHYTVDFPAAHPTRYEENNTGRGEYFRPRQGGNGTLAVFVHGWGDTSVLPCRLLAKALVKKGIACFILYLVFHSSRMPETIRKRGINLTPDEWLEGYRTSVIDVHQVVDWAGSLGEINRDRIAVIGISLGGMIAAISMGTDKRINAGVFLVTGGNYFNSAWLKKKDSRQEAEYREALNRYQQYLAEVAEKGYENVTPEKEGYLTDPMTFASYLRRRPVLMINARWDERIPRQGTLDFWEACGKPGIKWFPAGHASIWLLYPLLHRQITSFLRSTFGV